MGDTRTHVLRSLGSFLVNFLVNLGIYVYVMEAKLVICNYGTHCDVSIRDWVDDSTSISGENFFISLGSNYELI